MLLLTSTANILVLLEQLDLEVYRNDSLVSSAHTLLAHCFIVMAYNADNFYRSDSDSGNEC